MGFLNGKRALITGIASKRSIAYGIAQSMAEQGAELAFTYPNERFKERVTRIAAEDFNSSIVLPCDVASDDEINALFGLLKKHWDGYDILVHSIAYAPQDQLEGRFVDSVTREGFRVAHEISSYSLAALTQAGLSMMRPNGSVLTLTYLASHRTVPHYNTMALAKASLEANVRYLASNLGEQTIRANAISAGPIRTLAAAGIKHFKTMLDHNERITPMRKNVTIKEVGNASAFLCSDLASGITGEILHVDGGFHIVGLGENET
jgi:enoyl-[acyl-carrier protein] reductase I